MLDNIQNIILKIRETGNYTSHVLDALEMALEQRDFWHEEYLKTTKLDGAEQRQEDNYQLEIILKDSLLCN